GMPFVATMLGTTQVLPGPLMTPKIIAEMMEKYEVTISAGVPTIWLGLLQELNQGSYDTSSLRAILCGGSAAPKRDRKSTRLNSSHVSISYAVFCLKKKIIE